MELSNLEHRVVGIVAYPTKVQTFEVSFDRGILSKFSKLFVDLVNMKLEAHGSRWTLNSDEFAKYLTTLLYNRVLVSTYRKTTLQKGVLKRILIPSIFQLALSQIGEVQDHNTLEKFIPQMKRPKDLLSDEEMITLSDKLDFISNYGFEVNSGFEFEAKGNLHFMTWSLIDGNFFREDNQAPKSLGILHAFFEVQQLDNVIRPRICYGMKAYYDDLLHAVIVDSLRK